MRIQNVLRLFGPLHLALGPNR